MELEELEERLVPFVRTMLEDPFAKVANVATGPGHAGFTYFFDALSEGERTSYFLRLPPAGVKLEGTADVLRQVAALNAMAGTNVPHAKVIWSGDDPQWFGYPYFVQYRLPGDTLKDDYALQFTDEQRPGMAQAGNGRPGRHPPGGPGESVVPRRVLGLRVRRDALGSLL